MPDTLTRLRIHTVFTTKNREPLIHERLRPLVHRNLGGIITNQIGAPIAIGGTADHVHLLVAMRPTVSVSDMLHLIKGSSSRWARGRVNGFAWQVGYAAFSVGESALPAVRRYVLDQEEHHRRTSLADEVGELFREHGLDPDPRFIGG